MDLVQPALARRRRRHPTAQGHDGAGVVGLCTVVVLESLVGRAEVPAEAVEQLRAGRPDGGLGELEVVDALERIAQDREPGVGRQPGQERVDEFGAIPDEVLNLVDDDVPQQFNRRQLGRRIGQQSGRHPDAVLEPTIHLLTGLCEEERGEAVEGPDGRADAARIRAQTLAHGHHRRSRKAQHEHLIGITPSPDSRTRCASRRRPQSCPARRQP